jgi:hypothetical protein
MLRWTPKSGSTITHLSLERQMVILALMLWGPGPQLPR